MTSIIFWTLWLAACSIASYWLGRWNESLRWRKVQRERREVWEQVKLGSYGGFSVSHGLKYQGNPVGRITRVDREFGEKPAVMIQATLARPPATPGQED